MLKEVISLVILLSISLFISCNSKPSQSSDEANDLTTNFASHEKDKDVKSNQILSFVFNGDTFRHDLSQATETAGMRTNGSNWLLQFSGESSDKNGQIGLQFNIENFNLETGTIQVKICTLSLMGFEDSGITEPQLYALENIFLEITNIEKVKSESAMGATLEQFSIRGNFHGDFRNSTDEKTYKLENGSFENHILVNLKEN